ncbi:DNA-directed RNA pol I, largest subunit, partial [Kipferlia bialata]|eukprot:g8298.t1
MILTALRDEAAAAIAEKGVPEIATITAREARDRIIDGVLREAVDMCPHCRKKSPALRKEGVRKVFVTPLSDKIVKMNESIDGVGIPTTADGTATPLYTVMQKDRASASSYLSVPAVEDIINSLWDHTSSLFTLMFGSIQETKEGWRRKATPASMFFTVLPVLPSRIRPPVMQGGQVFDNMINSLYARVLEMNINISTVRRAEREIARDTMPSAETAAADAALPVAERVLSESVLAHMQMKSGERMAKLVGYSLQLQEAVNGLLDSATASVRNPRPGIRQLIEKKEGLFRMNLMGKRVNYAARSVISPDPWIATDEVGIPSVFATTLTFPEGVCDANLKRLSKSVRNGPNQWPGANFLQDELGRMINLGKKSDEERAAIAKTLQTPTPEALQTGRAKPKVVYRHLNNGDPMLVNRQPTLHRVSIMAHKVRVLPGQNTIRMHFASCASYNADFDGDEINLHAPQTYPARAEALQIMLNDRQYVTPTAGNPVRGLIQDHVVAANRMCFRGTFITRDEFCQLVTVGRHVLDPKAKVEVPAPAILFPEPLYSGKQVFTALLKMSTKGAPVTVTGKTRLKPGMFPETYQKWETNVTVRNSELLTGLIGKNHISAAKGGLVHAVCEVCGELAAGRLLTAIGRVCTRYLQMKGHTCSLGDCPLTKEGDRLRSTHIAPENLAAVSRETCAKFLDIPEQVLDADATIKGLSHALRTDETAGARLDSMFSGRLNQVTSAVLSDTLPNRLKAAFPNNCLLLMVSSGAKGSQVNISQIACLLGQQSLEGRRVPLTVLGKTLPCYEPYDPAPIANGFVADRFLTGLRPQSYFFHCMA